MKRIVLAVLLVLLLAGCTLTGDAINLEQKTDEINEKIKRMNEREATREVLLKEHGESLMIASDAWSFLIGSAGINPQTRGDQLEMIQGIADSLANDAYYCMDEDDIKRIVLPSRLTFRGDEMYAYAPALRNVTSKIKGYELFQATFEYVYKENDFEFESGQTKRLTFDSERLYLREIAFKNTENHMIMVMSDPHINGTCSVVDRLLNQPYDVYEINGIETTLVTRVNEPVISVTFNTRGNITSETVILEGIPDDFDSYDGKSPHVFNPQWRDDSKEKSIAVIAQLGDLSILNSPSIQWSWDKGW